MTFNPRMRTLHLIDIENLAGSDSCSPAQAQAAAVGYLSSVDVGPWDQVVLAASHHNAGNCFFSWPTPASRLCRSGENGAELALMDLYSVNEVAERFGRVVIGSGDGLFTDFAAALAGEGCSVTVVTRRDSLARRLSLAAGTVRYLPEVPESGFNYAA